MAERALRPTVKRELPEYRVTDDSLATLDQILRDVYRARGIQTLADVDYSLGGLLPVGTLDGIDDAVSVLQQHRSQRIVVIGDFDADGATSTALVLRCLRAFGFDNVGYLVPNRFEFGYGLTPEIVAVAASQSPSLLVTVDNGISSIAGVQKAADLGIRVLITDHHLPADELPAADAIVNPNVAGCQFGSSNLAGVGVAFYLMAALGRVLERGGQEGASKIPAKYLDLVALGTVADVVTLDKNNRVLVQQGLQRIRSGATVAGIRALFGVSGRTLTTAVSTDLGFAIGPRLNAAGRLEDMSVGIECLLTDDSNQANELAARLEQINADRKVIETQMRDEAFAYVDSMDASALPDCICLYDKHWHQGVVGLIASRVKERTYRPTIAFAEESDGVLKGSARSVPGIHIRDLLEAISSTETGLVTRFGGHAMAAGLSMPAANFERFAELAQRQLRRLYPSASFSGALLVDGALPASSLNLDFAKRLRDAGPWGAGFEEPLFCGDFELLEQRTVGEKHLKCRVRPLAMNTESSLPATAGSIDAIAFNQAGPVFRGRIQMTYRLDVNDFRGRQTPQLIVEQIRQI